MKRAAPLLLAFGIVLTACSGATDDTAATTSTLPPETVVVTIAQTGGCMMMGPNCPTYVVHAGGQVDLYRTGGRDIAVDTAHIDRSLVSTAIAEIGSTDLTTLRSRLAEGECQGCYDGIDTTMTFSTPAGDIVFDSIHEQLNASEPIFAAIWAVVDAAAKTADMPVEQRG